MRLRISRRQFLRLALYGSPGALALDSFGVEPDWLKVRHLRLARNPTHRIVHFTDLHHKGDRTYLEKVVAKINSLTADLACFTGDIVEENTFLPEALELIRKIR